ncbi:MAG: hypothetical protein Q8R02_11580 [Hyphomonadaceae bacterium]|nr:hypothetical protein [Hyphomonadaceae bacterium]
MTGYVLRLAPVLAAGWAAAFIAVQLPGLLSMSMKIDGPLNVELIRQPEFWFLLLIVAGFNALLTAAMWLVLALLHRATRNRFVTALAPSTLAGVVAGALIASAGAPPLVTAAVMLLVGWTAFLIAIAIEVGWLSSAFHALAAPNLILAMGVVPVILLAALAPLRQTECDERPSPEREKCIFDEEMAQAMSDRWAKAIREDDFDSIGSDAAFDDVTRSSFAASGNRILDEQRKGCALLPSSLRSECERGADMARVRLPGAWDEVKRRKGGLAVSRER